LHPFVFEARKKRGLNLCGWGTKGERETEATRKGYWVHLRMNYITKYKIWHKGDKYEGSAEILNGLEEGAVGLLVLLRLRGTTGLLPHLIDERVEDFTKRKNKKRGKE
jgi:hypothetical protein